MHPYLTNDQLSRLKAQLDHRRSALLADIRQELKQSDSAHFSDLAEQVHDRGDESVAYLLADVDLAVVDAHVREVGEIEAALLRLAEGRYGVCADCEGDIGFARLSAQPAALRCIDCQTRFEGSHYAPARSTL